MKSKIRVRNIPNTTIEVITVKAAVFKLLTFIFFYNLFFKFSLTLSNHSFLRILKIILSLRIALPKVGMWLRKTPSTVQPMLFMAAILRWLLLSARNSTRSIPRVSKANSNSKNLQRLLSPVPLKFLPYQV